MNDSGTVILFDSQDSVGQGKAKGNNSQMFLAILKPLELDRSLCCPHDHY